MTVTNIGVNEATQVVAVAVLANLSPLLPSLLQQAAHVTVTGFAQARIDGR
jgi:hypothetical protein